MRQYTLTNHRWPQRCENETKKCTANQTKKNTHTKPQWVYNMYNGYLRTWKLNAGIGVCCLRFISISFQFSGNHCVFLRVAWPFQSVIRSVVTSVFFLLLFILFAVKRILNQFKAIRRTWIVIDHLIFRWIFSSSCWTIWCMRSMWWAEWTRKSNIIWRAPKRWNDRRPTNVRAH